MPSFLIAINNRKKFRSSDGRWLLLKVDDDCLFSIVVTVVCADVAVAAAAVVAGFKAGVDVVVAVADVVAGFKAGVMVVGAVVAIADIVIVTAVIADVAAGFKAGAVVVCLLYTSPSPRDGLLSRMPSSA